jgi:hypothetical protein
MNDDCEQRAQLFLQHPDDCPALVEPLPYLIHPPGKLSATAAWLRFRDSTLHPLIAAKPDDRNLPRFLQQTETVLAWRATIAPERRFWKAD